MTITVERLFEESLLLSEDSRLKLAERIVESIEPEPGILAAQLAEAQRRNEELESGAVRGIAMDEALEHIRNFRGHCQSA